MLRMCWTRLTVLLAVSGGAVFGANFSFTGTFSQDDQLEIFKFTSTGGGATFRVELPLAVPGSARKPVTAA